MDSTICYIHPHWPDVVNCQFCANATRWRTLGMDAPNSIYPDLSSVPEQHPYKFSPIPQEDDYPDRFALSSDEAESVKDEKKAGEGAKLGIYSRQALKGKAGSIPKDQRKRRGRPPKVTQTQDSETQEKNKKGQAKEQELEQANIERRKNEAEIKKLDEAQMSLRVEPGRKSKVTQTQDSETREEKEVSKLSVERQGRKRKAVRFEDSESEEHQPATRRPKRSRNRVNYSLAQVDSYSD